MNMKRILLPVFLGLAIIVPFISQDRTFLTILILCFFHAYLALCWNLIGGFGGQISLGHGIFYGIGAYMTAALFIYNGVSPWIGMLIGAVAATVSAYLIGLCTFNFRISGIFFVLVTLALTQICNEVVKQIGFLGLSEGLSLPVSMGWRTFQFRDKNEYYYIILAFLVFIIFLSHMIKKSRLGYNLRAIREDEDTAAASGVDPKRTKNLIFMISAFFTAIGASFYLQFAFFIDPDSTFNFQLNIFLVLCAVIGGIGTITGPVLGAFFYVLLAETFRFLPIESQNAAAMSKIVFSLIMMCIMIISPRGIVGTKAYQWVLQKISQGDRQPDGDAAAYDGKH